MSSQRRPVLLLLTIATLAFAGCLQTSVGVRVGDPVPPTNHPEAPPPSVAKGPPPWAPAHGRRTKHAYRYYPQAEVYRDDSRGLWFYYEDGKWATGANLPVRIRIEVGDHVTVSMDTDTPYLHHKAVAERYPPGQTKAKHNKGKKKNKK